MAVYKVPQDVEADDKLIGPFSFKQFVFILIAIAMGWLAFMSFRVNPFLTLIPLPFFAGFLVLGLPLRKDQPTDVYVAAIINYMLRPKTRLWGQEGMTEHVIITAPKREEHQYSDGLSRGQVKSRLTGLAKTLDTRGWSSKNIDSPDFSQSDRLVEVPLAATAVADDADVDDVLDAENSDIARKFAQLEARSGTATLEQQAVMDQSVQGNIQTPGTQFVPEQSKPNIPEPRTVSEIAAIAEAKNPVQHQEIAPIYTGNAKMPEIASTQQPTQMSSGYEVESIKKEEVKTTLPKQESFSAKDINYNPYPDMAQQVVKPIKDDAKNKNTSQMTGESKTDILEKDNKSFEEGGEVKLR